MRGDLLKYRANSSQTLFPLYLARANNLFAKLIYSLRNFGLERIEFLRLSGFHKDEVYQILMEDLFDFAKQKILRADAWCGRLDLTRKFTHTNTIRDLINKQRRFGVFEACVSRGKNF